MSEQPVQDRILVVEDDDDFRFILERTLAKNNYVVASASNGVEALKIIDDFSPKVIVADWNMPQMDGLEFCNIVKQRPQHQLVYFILLTARSTLKDKITGLDVGADDFLIKPVENQELLARIRSGIRIFNLQEQLRQAEHNKAVVELACTIGHKLNNPLSALILSLNGIFAGISPSEKKKLKEEFMLISESVDRIKQSVKQLQNIDKPEIINYSGDTKMVRLD